MLEETSSTPRPDPSGNEEELSVLRSSPSSATITWRFNWNQAKQKQKCVQSKYVEVGGKDCRLLVYPFGARLAGTLTPGHQTCLTCLPAQLDTHWMQHATQHVLPGRCRAHHGAAVHVSAPRHSVEPCWSGP